MRRKAHRIFEYGTRIYRPTEGDGRWRVATTDVTGTRKQLGFGDERSAIAQARRWELHHAGGTAINAPAATPVDAAPGGVLVRDHAAAWISSKRPRMAANGKWIGWSQNYYDNTERVLRRHMLEVRLPSGTKWGDLLPERWSTADCEHLLTEGAIAHGPSTAEKIRTALTGLQSYMHRANVIPRGIRPAEALALPEFLGEEADDDDGPINRDTLPDDPAIEKLLVALKEAGEHDSAVMYHLKRFAGPRISELIAVRPQDFDFGSRSLLISRVWEAKRKTFLPTKNRGRRRVFWPESIDVDVRELVERAERQSGPKGLVWTNAHGGVWGKGSLRQRWIRAAQSADWPFTVEPHRGPTYGPDKKGGRLNAQLEWTPHTLRHVAATWMLFDVGMDPEMVSQVLGHHSVAFTMRIYVGMRGDITTRAKGLLDEW